MLRLLSEHNRRVHDGREGRDGREEVSSPSSSGLHGGGVDGPAGSSDGAAINEVASTRRPSAPLKGIKFDFKDPDAVLPTMALLRASVAEQQAAWEGVPVWLNADVLRGPGGGAASGTAPFDPNGFVRTCQEEYPEALLSLGWTTGPWTVTPGYSTSMVDAMIALCDRHALEHTTFAVAAYHLRQVSWSAGSPVRRRSNVSAAQYVHVLQFFNLDHHHVYRRAPAVNVPGYTATFTT